MSVARLYRLTEAKDRAVSPTEVAKRWGSEALVAFDRDVGQDHSHATFFIGKDPGGRTDRIHDVLYANVKGGGWWIYRVWQPDDATRDLASYVAGTDGMQVPDRIPGEIGKWEPTEKPGKERGQQAATDVISIVIELIAGPEEAQTHQDVIDRGRRHQVRVKSLHETPNGYWDFEFKGRGQNIVAMLREMGFDDEDIVEHFEASEGPGSFDADQLVRFGLDADVVWGWMQGQGP